MLLASDGRVKISDFGSARMVDHGHTTVRTMGTPAFLAPEMCEGAPYHGEVADIWALGICLYMFVYGTQRVTCLLQHLVRITSSKFVLSKAVRPAETSRPAALWQSDSLLCAMQLKLLVLSAFFAPPTGALHCLCLLTYSSSNMANSVEEECHKCRDGAFQTPQHHGAV